MINYKELMVRVAAGPEVTKAEAQAAITLLSDRMESEDAEAVLICANILGIACQSDSIEMVRRAIKLLCEQGPIYMEGIT